VVIKGETVRTGAPAPGTDMKILRSAAGWYAGFLDKNDEPYSRESDYYKDYHELSNAIVNDTVRWRDQPNMGVTEPK